MKFYRLDPALLGPFEADDTLLNQQICGLSEKLRPQDCIVLATWNGVMEVGEIQAFGLVVSLSTDRLSATVRWRRAEITLRPNPGGRQFWKNEKGWFCFAKEVVARYGLADLQAEFFPDYSGFDSPAPPAPAPRSSTTSSIPTPGFVYVIRSDHGYKTGKTKNMKNRTRLFEVKLPFPIEIAHYAWFEDYSQAERSLHLQYHAERLEGEWFALNAADLDHIKTQGKMIPVAGL